MAISPQRLTIYLYSAHRAVIFAIAQLSCFICSQKNSIVQGIGGIEDTNTHLVTSEPPGLRIPLSIGVYLAWSSNFLWSVYFTLVINDELTFDLTFILFVCSV